jgi:hydroxypyruvate isomerase
LFDIYHQQITEGNIISNILNNIEWIGHFHAAGVPGRHEITEGELNYKKILEVIDKTSYKGYVGLEYFPKFDPSVGLNKISTNL